MILRRLGTQSPASSACSGLENCPAAAEIVETGDFIFIGEDVTESIKSLLPPGMGCGPHERVVRIPRSLLLAARTDIPTE